MCVSENEHKLLFLLVPYFLAYVYLTRAFRFWLTSYAKYSFA